MILDEILKKEITNSQAIYLYRAGNFWTAYELSAFLLQKEFWHDLKVSMKCKVQTKMEYLRVGFIATSLNKVTDQVAGFENLTVHFNDRLIEVGEVAQLLSDKINDESTVLAIQGFDDQKIAFQRWKGKLQGAYEQAKQQMKPFYGALPVYKKSYDLMSLVLTTARSFPKELQIVLGDKLVIIMIEINEIFREICLTFAPDVRLFQIELIKKKLDRVMFLLRLAFDQQAYGLERNVRLMAQIGDINHQLNLWSLKMKKSS